VQSSNLKESLWVSPPFAPYSDDFGHPKMTVFPHGCSLLADDRHISALKKLDWNTVGCF
jgi:hypothetical protein